MSGTGQPPDEGGRDGFVPGKLAADFRGQVIDHQGQRTETVKPDNSKLIVDSYKHPRNVSPFILAGAVPKPPIELLVSTRERPSVMPFSERLDEDSQNALSKEATMTPERRHKFFARGRGARQRLQKSFPIAAGEHHAFVLVEHFASAFVGEIARSQSRDCHRPTDELLGRRADAKLDALSLGLTIRGYFMPG
jgi:hypothetical protein